VNRQDGALTPTNQLNYGLLQLLIYVLLIQSIGHIFTASVMSIRSLMTRISLMYFHNCDISYLWCPCILFGRTYVVLQEVMIRTLFTVPGSTAFIPRT
jgi:hypothetical protein